MSDDSNRRDGSRIDLRLRVRYSVGELVGEAAASNVSPKGVRFETEQQLPGSGQIICVLDADQGEALEAIGQIAWCRPHTSPTGRELFDVGVGFDNDWLANQSGPLAEALGKLFAAQAAAGI
jgi:hypothetical protein